MVYVADENTLEVALKPVIETYVRETSELVYLTVNGEKIVSTYDHPYFVKNKGFVNANALWIGAELVDNKGNILYVEQIFRETLDNEATKVYNFQVESSHTYYVGNRCILVHNAGKSYKVPVSGSGKEKATDIPRFKGERPFVGESGKDFAKRLCDEAFGKNNYKTGPGSDFNRLKKYGDRAFK